MNSSRTLICAIALIALGAAPALADDQLKVAIGQINNWENQAPTLGQDAGIFKKLGLVLENVGTQGAGETMQPVISGSADLGAGVGVAGVLRAFARGAPVRILLPAFTGTGDLYWYVRADSSLKTVKDVTASNTIAYSTSGSSSNNLVLAFADELGVKAKPTATGGPSGRSAAGLAALRSISTSSSRTRSRPTWSSSMRRWPITARLIARRPSATAPTAAMAHRHTARRRCAPGVRHQSMFIAQRLACSRTRGFGAGAVLDAIPPPTQA